MDRAAVITALQGYFGGRSPIVAAYLFGSVARDTAGSASDIDVAVILAAGVPIELPELDPIGDMQADLESLLRCEVDLVAMNGAAPDFLHRILRDGVLLAENDVNARILFEARARIEYFDVLPILQLYRRMVLGSV